MKISHLLFFMLAVSIISGCASSGNQFPKISHEDAASFEKTLMNKHAAPSPRTLSEQLYIQPINKREECELPTSSEQLQRRNFKAYWDGDCKNGFAYGFGRDIAISDTHHYEEIIMHDGTNNYRQQPIIDYDFVNNFVSYSFVGENRREGIGLQEKYEINNNSLSVTHTVKKVDGEGNTLMIQSSPLSPNKIYTNYTNGVAFVFSDATGIPAKFDDVVYSVEIKNREGIPGGVAIAKFGNGEIRHLKIENTGQKKVVQIPQSYIDHIETKRQEIFNAIPEINKYLELAKKTEREYLYLACNGKHEIKGLDNKTATKICSWRNDLEPMYLAAIENAKKQMEQRLQIVEKAENERVLKQQIAQQQRVIEQQRNQQAMNEITNSLNSLSNSLRNSAMQTQQFIQPMPVYQPAPFGSSGRINCITTGPLTSCR